MDPAALVTMNVQVEIVQKESVLILCYLVYNQVLVCHQTQPPSQ